MNLTENHTKTHYKGKPAKPYKGIRNAWERTSKLESYYGIDTFQGCNGKCIGCFAAKMSTITHKNFTDIKKATIKGKIRGAFFFWTRLQKRVPKVLRGHAFNITIDPFRPNTIKKVYKNIKVLDPSKVLLAFRHYPGNRVSELRVRALAQAFAKLGFTRKFHLVVRLSKKQALSIPFGGYANVWHPRKAEDKKPWYKKYSLKNFGVSCGSIGNGKCGDCNLCYKLRGLQTRIGTLSDPEINWSHTVSILKEKGVI